MRLHIFAVLCFFFLPAAHAASAQELNGREYAEAMLLLSPYDFNIRLAAKSIQHIHDGRLHNMDLLAELTWMACEGRRTQELDTLSWFAKFLGRSQQPRYASVLDYCLTHVTHEKTLRHIKQAREGLQGTAANPFVAGKMDLEEVRARLARLGNTAPRPAWAQQFNALHQGQLLEDIFSAFGTPNKVSAVNIKGKKVGFVVNLQLTDDMIVFEYNTLGTILFVYNTPEDKWQLAFAKGDNGLFWNRQTGRFGTFGELIESGGETELREVMKKLSKQKDIDKTTLDQLARRIYLSRGEKNGEMADILAHLCRIIGKSGNGRYRQVLLDISNSAEESTLRKHAGKAADELPVSTDEKFVPGPG